MNPPFATEQASTNLLPEPSRDVHHALVSLEEELQAVDAYDLRIASTGSAELRAILQHNRDEEKEHAAMLLEWIRRSDEGWDQRLRENVFRAGPVVATEHLAGFAAGQGTATEREG